MKIMCKYVAESKAKIKINCDRMDVCRNRLKGSICYKCNYNKYEPLRKNMFKPDINEYNLKEFLEK